MSKSPVDLAHQVVLIYDMLPEPARKKIYKTSKWLKRILPPVGGIAVYLVGWVPADVATGIALGLLFLDSLTSQLADQNTADSNGVR